MYTTNTPIDFKCIFSYNKNIKKTEDTNSKRKTKKAGKILWK